MSKPAQLARLPRYRFVLNPYRDERFSRCPQCGQRTRRRKVPLVIHVDPMFLLALNKTCCYCPPCDLLIAHQDEVEEQLAMHLAGHSPDLVGNSYFVMGTLDQREWQKGRNRPLEASVALQRTCEFRAYIKLQPGERRARSRKAQSRV